MEAREMGRRLEATPLPRSAALYPRVSDPAQDRDDKTSMKTQEGGERAWALANGYAVDEQYIYRERHSAEEYYERPELTRVRADAKAHKFALVVVHSVERLARDAIHLGIIIEELDRVGVKVHFVTEPIDNDDGIPSPTGRVRWVGNTVRYFLNDTRYWGQGETLRSKEVPVEKHLRARYATKTRTVLRDASERYALPTSSVPPFVEPAVAAAAQAHLGHNRDHATRNNRYPERALLRGGIARCGYCGDALYANNRHSTYGGVRTTDRCTSRHESAPDCRAHGMEAHLLDAAAWAKFRELLPLP